MPYLLIAPAILFCVIFRALPLAIVGALSFWETDFMDWEYVGFSNYTQIFTTDLWQPIPNTFLYVALCVPLTVGLALGVSLMAQHVGKARQHTIRFLFYLPSLVSGVIIATIFRWAFDYDGPVNWLLMKLGGARVIWFADRLTTILPISAIQSLLGTGVFVIMFMAALKAIPVEHYEAANIEGASRRQIRRMVMIPQILPTIGLVTIMVSAGTLQMFGWIYMLAPYKYAATIMYSIFHEGFLYGRFGVAAAYSVLLMVLTAVMIILQRRARRWR